MKGEGGAGAALLPVGGGDEDFADTAEGLGGGPEAGGMDSVVVGQQDFQGVNSREVFRARGL